MKGEWTMEKIIRKQVQLTESQAQSVSKYLGQKVGCIKATLVYEEINGMRFAERTEIRVHGKELMYSERFGITQSAYKHKKLGWVAL